MAKCEFCDKGVTFGIQVSHSHRRSNRPWKPNVKRVKAMVNGTPPCLCLYPLSAFR
jgi:large subunit ribosomal protein L28